MSTKETIRREILNWRRNTLSKSNRRAWSRSICDRFQNMVLPDDAQKLLLYAPYDNEVDIKSLLDSSSLAEHMLFLPKVKQSSHGLEIYELRNRTSLLVSLRESKPVYPLINGRYGVFEPDPDECERVDHEKITMAVIPGVAFDREGNRIGFGKGYYDRLLSEFTESVTTVGFCYDAQLVDYSLPVESHDESVKYIVTETETVHIP